MPKKGVSEPPKTGQNHMAQFKKKFRIWPNQKAGIDDFLGNLIP